MHLEIYTKVVNYIELITKQLLDEVEHDIKNYSDRGQSKPRQSQNRISGFSTDSVLKPLILFCDWRGLIKESSR